MKKRNDKKKKAEKKCGLESGKRERRPYTGKNKRIKSSCEAMRKAGSGNGKQIAEERFAKCEE